MNKGFRVSRVQGCWAFQGSRGLGLHLLKLETFDYGLSTVHTDFWEAPSCNGIAMQRTLRDVALRCPELVHSASLGPSERSLRLIAVLFTINYPSCFAKLVSRRLPVEARTVDRRCKPVMASSAIAFGGLGCADGPLSISSHLFVCLPRKVSTKPTTPFPRVLR